MKLILPRHYLTLVSKKQNWRIVLKYIFAFAKFVPSRRKVGGLPVHNVHAWSAKNNVEIHSVDSNAGIIPKIYSFIN